VGGFTAAARKDAAARLQAMGLPGARDEYWRYTNPAPFNAPVPEALAQQVRHIVRLAQQISARARP